MMNVLIHEYFGVSPTILWQTVKEDLPLLVQKVEALREE